MTAGCCAGGRRPRRPRSRGHRTGGKGGVRLCPAGCLPRQAGPGTFPRHRVSSSRGSPHFTISKKRAQKAQGPHPKFGERVGAGQAGLSASSICVLSASLIRQGPLSPGTLVGDRRPQSRCPGAPGPSARTARAAKLLSAPARRPRCSLPSPSAPHVSASAALASAALRRSLAALTRGPCPPAPPWSSERLPAALAPGPVAITCSQFFTPSFPDPMPSRPATPEGPALP